MFGYGYMVDYGDRFIFGQQGGNIVDIAGCGDHPAGSYNICDTVLEQKRSYGIE